MARIPIMPTEASVRCTGQAEGRPAHLAKADDAVH